jgi:hypothetical protein
LALRKAVISILMISFLCLIVVPSLSPLSIDAQTDDSAINVNEGEILSLINGTRAYDYDLSLENIAYSHSAFRSAGSSGANETANWIKTQFESFGLATYLEPFQFTTWDLTDQPSLVIDDDGNPATTADQIIVRTFQCEHFSWPTPAGGSFSDLVVLPLPACSDYSQIGANPINTTAWNTVNTTGKILFIGREVRWAGTWQQAFRNKITSQTPEAVVYTWWYDWMSFTPPMFSSTGGRPLGSGPYFWELNIPTGFVDYNDGVWIRSRESASNVSAGVEVPAVIGTGTHYNVIGKISGYMDPTKMVIISGHYDTIMGSGFCDNGAGTAGVLELAKSLTDAVRQGLYRPTYTLVFVAFTGEELGLVGSINYIAEHKSEMSDVWSVLNLDCIGSTNFFASETAPANGFRLDEIVMQAASDLGVYASTEPNQGDSDHATFISPSWANSICMSYWGIDPQISDAQPVPASTTLASYPLVYIDEWITGTPGWIHTAWDNSTSTSTLNWVEVSDLENHIKIAALTTIRVSPNTPELPRNVSLMNITLNKIVVGKPYSMRISVIVQNQGSYAEYVNITVNANSTMIETFRNVLVIGSGSAEVTSTWNTSQSAFGNYVVRADVSVLPEETNATDNTLTSTTGILVAIAGDVTSVSGQPDWKVDMRDIGAVCEKFGTRPSDSAWNPIMDIDDDSTVNMRDIGIACSNFGQHYP